MLKKQIVASSMVNTESKLSVIATFQLIQDAVTELTGTLKIDGVTIREKYNAFWVFVKTKVKFFKEPAWNDEVTVNVFISGISLAKMYIDCKVTDRFGDLAIYSRTELCVLDLDTQRIKKVESVGVNASMLSQEECMDMDFCRPKECETSVVDRVKVRYTNIDFCHHTNNLEYMRLILNTFSVSEMESRKFKEIQIDYLSQSYENDTLCIKKAELKGRDIFVLEKDQNPVARCEIIF